jgi:hypothetical protein
MQSTPFKLNIQPQKAVPSRRAPAGSAELQEYFRISGEKGTISSYADRIARSFLAYPWLWSPGGHLHEWDSYTIGPGHDSGVFVRVNLATGRVWYEDDREYWLLPRDVRILKWAARDLSPYHWTNPAAHDAWLEAYEARLTAGAN